MAKPIDFSARWRATATPWLVVALASEVGWSAFPVLARYLQTVSRLPSLALLAGGNALAFAVLALVILPRIDLRVFRSRLLWFFALIVVARSTTNVLATRFTLAILVQLVTLSTPFVVALLSALLLGERLPHATGRVLAISLLGALLIIRGGFGAGDVHITLVTRDWLGIGLALASSGFLATYMILIRRSVHHRLPGESVLIMRVIALVAVTTPTSLILGEDWSRWGALRPSDWAVFAVFSLGVLLAAALGQVGAIRHLGAPLVSSLQPGRLVLVLLLSALLLGERLTSPLQALGALLVVTTLTWYLWKQRDKGQRSDAGPVAARFPG